MPEVSGTVKTISPSGKGILLKEYETDAEGQDQWFNRGKGFKGAWPAKRDEAVTLTYEQTFDADGKAKFWVLEAWPTSQGRRTPPTGEQPRTGPVPTGTPAEKPDSYEGYQAAASGPVPTPPSRENAILFQVCLKAAQEWVLARYSEGDVNRTEGQVLFVADLYYREGLAMISGEYREPQDGDPGPGEPA